jgi:hypothetical protein
MLPALRRLITRNLCSAQSPRRNQEFLNQAAPVMTLGWQANIDIEPSNSKTGVLNYVAKYVSKPEKKSESYKEMQGQVGSSPPVKLPVDRKTADTKI